MKTQTKRKNIKGLEFSAPSPAKIISYSNIQLTNKFLYSQSQNQTIQGGILDTKMGAIHKNLCKTCEKNSKKCIGHCGYIKLFLPVFNIGYIKAIQIILQIICKACSRVLIEPGKKREALIKKIRKIRKKGDNYRVEYIANLIKKCKKTDICPYCLSKNGKIKKPGNYDFVHMFDIEESESTAFEDNKIEKDTSNYEEIELNPLIIFLLFQKIKFEDLEILDIDEIETRPENLITCFIPVPPLIIRPSINVKEKMSNEDDLTIKLSEIYTTNVLIKKNLEKETSFFQLKNNWDFLQVDCVKYLNSETFPLEKNSRPFKSLFKRLKGKNGRFRGNLSGKRVDFSGRTIISPDPNVPLNFLGFPLQLATKLTFPEKVTKNNIERLQRNILRGSSKFPGAIFFIDEKKQKKVITISAKEKDSFTLKEGFLIERHLKNNDIVLFNRQPSLHRISLMAHRIKLIPGKTFKFNECVCKPYNADFDGDEMNVHIPQTQKARAEAISLLNIVINLNSPGNGESQVSATQDFLSASFLITCKDQFFSESEIGLVFSLLKIEEIKNKNTEPSILKPHKLWTGKQIFSLVFSEITEKSSQFKTKENILYDANKLIYQKMEKLYSLDERQCSSSLCPFDGWIFFRNRKLLAGQIGKLTIGSGNKNSLMNFFSSLDSFDFLTKCLLKISKLSSGWLSNYGFSFSFKEILPTFGQIKKKKRLIYNSYNICESIKNQSNLKKKKNFESFVQKIFGNLRKDLGVCCIDLYNYNKNSGLIMVASGSKGSIINLSQIVACLGQQSILGNRISKGFIGRILPHLDTTDSLYNPRFKGFIENSFYEGLDGIDFFFHSMAGREGLVDTAIKTAESGYLQRRMVKTLEDIIIFYDLSTRTSDGRLVQLNFSEDCFDSSNLSLVYNSPCFNNQKLKSFKKTDNNSIHFFEKTTLLRSISFINMDSIPFFIKNRDFFFYFLPNSNIATFLFRYIEQHCCKVLNTSKICQIEPGTCVGAISAQSLGEPGTQMTLQTFHFTGISDMNITLGVPRINEILNASKKIAVFFIKFKFFSLGKKENFHKFKIQLEKIYLGDICERINIQIEPKEMFIEIFVKRKNFKNLNLHLSLKKIIKKIKKIGMFWKKSRFFYNPFRNFIQIFPIKKKNSICEEKNWVFRMCKKDLPEILIFGCVNPENIEIDKNFLNSAVLLKNARFGKIFELDFVDKNTIYCTHILSIFENFGIEAARQSIIVEIKTIFDLYKISINKRYLAILADLMTFRGEILGATRYGLAKMKKNFLVLASFEKTIENLFSAATKVSKDEILSVSENIILGKNASNGTGIVSLSSLK